MLERSNSWERPPYPVQLLPTDKSKHVPGENGNVGKPEVPKNIKAQKDADDSSERTIVLCLDGTGDKFDADNSNIVHIVSCLKKDDPRQITYYQAGIGTYNSTGLSGGISSAMDMAVGSGLGLHVREAYHFLMHSYQEGDKICILGFSRGAYTARCLAGMVHKVGLLPARNIAQIPFAYEFYKDGSPQGWEQSAEFKKTFCIDVNIYFIGVFDSVSSVGFIPRTLPLASTPFNRPAYFRQAMALDERRAKFKINRYKALARDNIDMDPTKAAEYQREVEKRSGSALVDTDVQEIWFLGAHADVGGGAVKNVERHKLSNIPLRWMIRQCFECNTGIIFKAKSLAEMGLDVQTLWPKYTRLQVPKLGPSPKVKELYEEGLAPIHRRSSKLKPTNGTDDDSDENGHYHVHAPTDQDEAEIRREWVPEQAEDYFDALCPINDQLIQAKNWWILEYWPVKYRVQSPTGEWIKVLGFNRGRYRAVIDPEPKMHWTVQHRSDELGYKVQARNGKNTFWSTIC